MLMEFYWIRLVEGEGGCTLSRRHVKHRTGAGFGSCSERAVVVRWAGSRRDCTRGRFRRRMYAHGLHVIQPSVLWEWCDGVGSIDGCLASSFTDGQTVSYTNVMLWELGGVRLDESHRRPLLLDERAKRALSSYLGIAHQTFVWVDRFPLKISVFKHYNV